MPVQVMITINVEVADRDAAQSLIDKLAKSTDLPEGTMVNGHVSEALLSGSVDAKGKIVPPAPPEPEPEPEA